MYNKNKKDSIAYTVLFILCYPKLSSDTDGVNNKGITANLFSSVTC